MGGEVRGELEGGWEERRGERRVGGRMGGEVRGELKGGWETRGERRVGGRMRGEVRGELEGGWERRGERRVGGRMGGEVRGELEGGWEERETDLWHQLEQAEKEENRASRYGHKGRNNNNNTQEKTLPPSDHQDPSMCDHRRPSWCHQYPYALSGPAPASTFDPALNSAPLPCRGYDQPILPHSGLYHNPDLPHNPGLLLNPIPPQYPGPTRTVGYQNPEGPHRSGLARLYGGQEGSVSVMSTPLLEEWSAQERPIRVISVGYDQPILPHSGLYHNPDLPHNPGLLLNPIPPQYPGPTRTVGYQNPEGPHRSGLARLYGGQEGSVSVMSTPLLEEWSAQERPIRVISV
ncbi:unnamed protein product [Coregonus sp. 'balchen']|nr:unnamed protein product [Coregonus sp. 'balchen']